jgi:hypothetical protein
MHMLEGHNQGWNQYFYQNYMDFVAKIRFWTPDPAATVTLCGGIRDAPNKSGKHNPVGSPRNTPIREKNARNLKYTPFEPLRNTLIREKNARNWKYNPIGPLRSTPIRKKNAQNCKTGNTPLMDR